MEEKNKKEDKRNFAVGCVSILIIIGVIVFILHSCVGSPISKMKIKPVMNGSQTQEIGKYGVVEYNPSKMTDEDLVKFYNEKVKDSGLNWVTLIDKNNDVKQIVFPGSMNIIEYRTLKDNKTDYTVDKSRMIRDDKIEDMKGSK